MADTFQTIRCPACGSVMKKIFVPSAGVNVDVCSEGCGGVFFDCKELKAFEGSSENVNEINEVLAGKSFTPVDSEQTRMCPVCASKMIKTKINGLEVVVDTCYSCGGVFLDYGELDQIRDGFAKNPVKKIKEQNKEVDVNLLREFYADTQKNRASNHEFLNTTLDILSISNSRRAYGFIDLLHDLFR